MKTICIFHVPSHLPGILTEILSKDVSVLLDGHFSGLVCCLSIELFWNKNVSRHNLIAFYSDAAQMRL